MSHDQRFEELVRNTLRDEGMSLPVTASAVQLRERAAGRRRSFTMQTKAVFGVLLPLVAVVAVAVVSSFDRPSDLPAVGVSPSPSGIEGSPSPSTPATILPSPTPEALPFQVASGAVITVSQAPVLRVESTLDGVTTLLYERSMASLGLADESMVADGVAVSTTGLLAITRTTETDGVTTYYTALLDMTVPNGRPVLVAGRSAAFGQDGDLITIEQDPDTHGYFIHRRLAGTDMQIAFPEPVGVSVGTFNGQVQVASDGSGLFAARSAEDDTADWIPVILRWDGSTVDRAPTTRPFADTGVRTTGPNGEQIVTGCDTGQTGGGCVTRWRAPDGTFTNLDVPDGAFPNGPFAWSASGDKVYFAAEKRVYVVRASDKVVTRFAGLSQQGSISAFTDAIYVQTFDEVERIPFAAADAKLRIPGQLALVVP